MGGVHAADDKPAAVVVHQQRRAVFVRPIMARADLPGRARQRHVGRCDVDFHTRELCDRHVQQRPCGRHILAEDEALRAREALRSQHQLQRGVQGVAVDGDRAAAHHQPLQSIGYPRNGVQCHFRRCVQDPISGAAPGWQALSHGFSLSLIKLNDRNSIPQVGLGVFQTPPNATSGGDRAGRGLPAYRHRLHLRQRGRDRPGDRQVRRPARMSSWSPKCGMPTRDTTTHCPRLTPVSIGSASIASTCT